MCDSGDLAFLRRRRSCRHLMVDVVDTATRSRMMAGIRAENTKPELTVRKGLHARGYRYRLHSRKAAGKPDLVLPRHRAAIFVHGCFWHGHNCHLFRMPATRTEFWRAKIAGNRQRDDHVREALLQSGWRRLVIWECALKGRERLELSSMLDGVCDWIESGGRDMEIAGTGALSDGGEGR